MLQIITKSIAIRRALPSTLVRRTFADDHKPTADDDDTASVSGKPKAAVKAKDATAGTSNRLNELLASMSTDSNLNLVKTVVATKTKPAKLGGKRNSKAEEADSSSSDSDDDNIERAVKDVAAAFGGDVKQTESELLAKLLLRGGSGTETGEQLKINDLISGMQIDRMDGAKSSVQPKRAQFVRKSIENAQDRRGKGGQFNEGEQQTGDRRPFQRRQQSFDGKAAENAVSVNLFGEKSLGIFLQTADALQASPDILQTWAKLQARDLQLAVTHPPSNHFQKMALWTEQGKLWQFPIDNEQGLAAEATVCFTEHIFLDRHLEGWCPNRGPVRHFMELVCVGLSKNPYYTVQQKVDHINWYRQYFEEKKDLLQQVIVDKTAAAAAEAAATQTTVSSSQ